MPKVIRIINRLNLGGPTYNAAYLSKYLAPEFETILLSGLKQDSEASSKFILETLGLQAIDIPSMEREINPYKDYHAYRNIYRIIEKEKPDIVHTHAAKAGALGRLAAHKLKVPVILHTFHGHVFHSYFGRMQSAFYLQVERYLAKRSTRIIAISDLQKHELGSKFKVCPPEKIEVIPLGFDLDRFQVDNEMKRQKFRAAYNIADYEIVIMIVGRIVPVKNHGMFIQAIHELSKLTDKKFRAVIVGDGSDRQSIEALCDRLKLSYGTGGADGEIVIFTSWIQNVEEPLAAADVVAMTSWNEGTPVSLIEAQACGIPVVSTNVGGIENVVLENRSALLSEPGDAKVFADNLLKMFDDDFRIRFSIDGKKFVIEKFHYHRLVKDMGLLYNKLLISA